MVIGDIRRVLIVGSGTMGIEIGFQCALYGCEVALSDARPRRPGDPRWPAPRAYGQEIVAAGLPRRRGLARRGARPRHLDAGPSRSRLRPTPTSWSSACPRTRRSRGACSGSSTPPARPARSSRPTPRACCRRCSPPRRAAGSLGGVPLPLPVWQLQRRRRDAARRDGRRTDDRPHVGVRPEAHRSGLDPRLQREPRLCVQRHVQHGQPRGHDARRQRGHLRRGRRPGLDGHLQDAVGPFGMLDDVGLDTVWHITDFWARTLGETSCAGTRTCCAGTSTAAASGARAALASTPTRSRRTRDPGSCQAGRAGDAPRRVLDRIGRHRSECLTAMRILVMLLT